MAHTVFYFSAYLIFVFFLHRQNFGRIKFTPKKRVNYDKIHSKLPIFCVITAKYTVNCQFFALNLSKFTPAKKKLHGHVRGDREKYQVCSLYFQLKQTLKLKDDVLLHHARPHYQIPLFLCNDALFREVLIQYDSLEWFHSVISSHFKTSKASLHALVLG